jgi:putative colanic acid biosynthesis glycosyltransferase
MSPDLPSVGVVTVTYNDCANLVNTVRSVMALRYPDLRYWIVDGASSDGTRAFLDTITDSRVACLSEPDRGLWDAMNKGLDRATSDYLIFLNSGDRFHPSFDLVRFMQRLTDRRHVAIGYCVKSYRDLHFLQPGLSREVKVFTGPAHQAIFYPRAYYRRHRYLTDKNINADGYYSLQAVAECGAEFIPEVISMFALGGRSTSYAGLKSFRDHVSDDFRLRKITQTTIKWLAWQLLPRRAFYWLLFSYKWTPLKDPYSYSLPSSSIVREPTVR